MLNVSMIMNIPCFGSMMIFMYFDTVEEKVICKLVLDILLMIYPFFIFAGIVTTNERWKRAFIQ